MSKVRKFESGILVGVKNSHRFGRVLGVRRTTNSGHRDYSIHLINPESFADIPEDDLYRIAKYSWVDDPTEGRFLVIPSTEFPLQHDIELYHAQKNKDGEEIFWIVDERDADKLQGKGWNITKLLVVKGDKPRMPKVGQPSTPSTYEKGGELAVISPKEFFQRLSFSNLPDKSAEFIQSEILADPQADLLDENNPTFRMIKDLIEQQYPTAIMSAPVIEDAPPAAAPSAAPSKSLLETRLKIVTKMLAANKADVKLKMRKKVIEGMLKEGKFELGGSVADSDPNAGSSPTIVTTTEQVFSAHDAEQHIPDSAKQDGQYTIVRDGSIRYFFRWHGSKESGYPEFRHKESDFGDPVVNENMWGEKSRVAMEQVENTLLLKDIWGSMDEAKRKEIIEASGLGFNKEYFSILDYSTLPQEVRDHLKNVVMPEVLSTKAKEEQLQQNLKFFNEQGIVTYPLTDFETKGGFTLLKHLEDHKIPFIETSQLGTDVTVYNPLHANNKQIAIKHGFTEAVKTAITQEERAQFTEIIDHALQNNITALDKDFTQWHDMLFDKTKISYPKYQLEAAYHALKKHGFAKGGSVGVYENGGHIKNQYEGKTAEQVWAEWSLSQRTHFLSDHLGKQSTPSSIQDYSKKNYKFLPANIKKEVSKHLSEGQYSIGGVLVGAALGVVTTIGAQKLSKTTFPEKLRFYDKKGSVGTDGRVYEMDVDGKWEEISKDLWDKFRIEADGENGHPQYKRKKEYEHMKGVMDNIQVVYYLHNSTYEIGGQIDVSSVNLTEDEMEGWEEIFKRYEAKNYFGTNELIENKEKERIAADERGNAVAKSVTKSDIEKMYRDQDRTQNLAYFKKFKKFLMDGNKDQLKKIVRPNQKMSIEFLELLTGRSMKGMTNQSKIDAFINSLPKYAPKEISAKLHGKYVYRFHEERGEAKASVEDMATGETVWETEYPDSSLSEEDQQGQSSIVDDGYMKNWDDISGLEKYLKSMKLLPKHADLVSEREAMNKYNYYARGGQVKSKKRNRKKKGNVNESITKLCPEGTQIKTLVFDSSKFSKKQAVQWASTNGFYGGKGGDVRANTIRVRYQEASRFDMDSLQTIPISEGIQAIVGSPKK